MVVRLVHLAVLGRRAKGCRSAALLAVGALLWGASAAAAQTPYAGREARPIKALSEQEVADLRAGRGHEAALAAELNGYPGPIHVLELADRLSLSADQRTGVEALFAGMKEEAVALGEQVIGQEADLDRRFVTRTITPETLQTITAGIGRTRAALRHVHLRHHLATRDVLTAEQTRLYSELRGYGGPPDHGRHRPGHHP